VTAKNLKGIPFYYGAGLVWVVLAHEAYTGSSARRDLRSFPA